jgi:methionyl-tRNA formyltransferase
MAGKAVVFAYHDVGVRCLQVLLEQGVEVPLVFTHQDSPTEHIWFASVAELAAAHGIEVVTPEDPNTPECTARIAAINPDFLFSFYYRLMLKPALLATARRGAFNMHGSLLPKYRGRVPVNWAVLYGETETGATLHEMVAKPDAGRIVDQQAVAIGADDQAADVFRKVTAAAETVLRRCLPALLDGSAVLRAQDLSLGGYFGGRKPADGRISWIRPAQEIHNLVRAVAPPYPGAYTELGGKPLFIHRTRLEPGGGMCGSAPGFYASRAGVDAVCADGRVLALLEMQYEDKPFTPADFLARFGARPVPLPLS